MSESWSKCGAFSGNSFYSGNKFQSLESNQALDDVLLHRHCEECEYMFFTVLCRLNNRTVGQNVVQYYANPLEMHGNMQIDTVQMRL